MIFDYEELEFYDETTRKRGTIYRPKIKVNLIKRGFRLFPVDCLLDSGADAIIFPTDAANYYKINYKKGRQITSQIAGGGSTIFYELPFEKHQISIFISDIHIKEKICFSEGQKTPLLGQDFFKYFKIAFDRFNKKISLDLK
ncbi:hypothetical protein HYW83_06675 [Candidatus Peregrinibacteria bacterium]|nr:hypothetical protein [Candidatus Peregrinibacteria bacterium]